MSAPRFGLVIVGDEILSGKRADKHLVKVDRTAEGAGTLSRLGSLRGR